MPKRVDLKLKEGLTDHYVAFLDVMGFSALVNKGNVDNLESYFAKITEILDKLRIDKEDIKSFLISDSIILIARSDFKDFIQLLWAIRRIQGSLLFRKILLRGAVSFGQVYYNDEHNIIVGKGFIRAYLLEQEANFPRIILDPSIVKKVSNNRANFLKRVNGATEYNFANRHIHTKGEFTRIADDGIFVDYANKSIGEHELNDGLRRVYELIKQNLYGEQQLYSKYAWLRDYFWETLMLTHASLNPIDEETISYMNELTGWIERFEQL